MNVLMLTSLLPDPDSVHGGAVVMHGQLMALAASHDVTLLSVAEDAPDQRAAALALQRSGLDLHCVWRPAPGTPLRHVERARLAARWMRSEVPLRSLAFHRDEMQALIDRITRENAFDLVQVEDNAMGAYRLPPNVPSLLTEHEVRMDEALAPSSASQRTERQRWLRFQRQVWARFPCIQVFTPRDAASIARLAPDVAPRVHVNPFGIALTDPADPNLERPGDVVFVGSFLHSPNVDAARWLGESIMPLLRRLVPGVRLSIVGSDPPRRVQALATADVEVTGRVPDVAPYLERASVVVAPLRIGGGMRLKVLQAMALGKAVVTTPLGAEGLVGDVLPLVVAEDADALAHATAGLLADQASRRDLGRRARAYVAEHYTWAAYAGRVETLYRELATRPVAENIAAP